MDAQHTVQGDLPNEETPVSENVQVLDEVQISDKDPALDETAIPNDAASTEVLSDSKETPADDENVPEANQICEDRTPHDAVPVEEEPAVPEEHVSEVIQSSEESVLPQESSPSEALGTVDENVLEEMHNSEDRSPDVLPASDDVPTHQNEPQDTSISEEIKPSVEIQVM